MSARGAQVRRGTKQKQSYADAVYDLLRRDILQGTSEPGQRLRENELSERYRVSRTPIREALNRLEHEGLVVGSPGRGLIVAEVDEHEILEGYVIRGALEGVAARLAAQRATDVDLAKLDLLLDAITKAAADDDEKALLRLSGEIHFHIWRVAGNRRLLKLMQDIEDGMGRFQRLTLFTPGRMQHAIDEHHAMVEAIRAGDGDRAEQLAREHMNKAQHARVALSVQQHSDPAGAPASGRVRVGR